MNTNDIKFLRIIYGFAVWMFVSLSVSGCANAPRSPGPQLNAVPLPTYGEGTTFVYSDGTWELVMDASAETVTWKDHRNSISSGSRDFTRRRTKWQTKNRSGTRQYGPRGDLIVKSDITLWPLQVGNTANYSETGIWTDKDGAETNYQSLWSCEVAGTERRGQAGDVHEHTRAARSEERMGRRRLGGHGSVVISESPRSVHGTCRAVPCTDWHVPGTHGAIWKATDHME